MAPALKKAYVLRMRMQKMSNGSHGFLINPQLEIQSADEHRGKISGCATKGELRQS